MKRITEVGKEVPVDEPPGAVPAPTPLPRWTEPPRAWLGGLRERHWLFDAAFGLWERDWTRQGPVLSAALAYRLFLWLLPFTLVLVTGLGFLADADEAAARDLAEDQGALGLTADSIADAARPGTTARVLALLIGIPALYIASVAAVKALRSSHAFVWDVPLTRLRRAPLAAIAFTGFIVGINLFDLGANVVRGWGRAGGFVAEAVTIVVYAGSWIAVSMALPHRPVRWTAFIPGGLIVAAGEWAMYLIIVWVAAPRFDGDGGTYGVLGAFAGMLLALFVFARAVLLAAEVNAELAARRQPAQETGV
jgi:uncharacterized BrkB/YihY/UPF0761 family membrane protein